MSASQTAIRLITLLFLLAGILLLRKPAFGQGYTSPHPTYESSAYTSHVITSVEAFELVD